MLELILNNRRRITIFSVIVFLSLTITYTVIALIVSANSANMQKIEIGDSETRLIDVEREIISNKTNRLISDLLFISDSYRLYKAGITDEVGLKQQWVAFANRKRVYDQIRFIDAEGNEKIRINLDNNDAYAVKQDKLQNKKQRQYFKDAITLNNNQLYISRLDLNMENGQVEQPLKPMIRLAAPYYNAQDKLEGIIVLNYMASDMLQQVKKISSASRGNVYMLNATGYWIFNEEDSATEWAFMYDDKKNISFQKEYPSEWKRIISSAKGSFVTPNGLFSHTTTFTSENFTTADSSYSLVLGEGDWHIISHLTATSQNGQLFTAGPIKFALGVARQNLYLYGFMLLLSIMFSMLVILNKEENEKIRYFSEYDVMTGIYNRRAGFDKLAKLSKNAANSNTHISICFIDINGLKQVNDTLGHKAGDELILSVIHCIKKNIRESDFISRLGGDEFLIIFQNTNIDEAEHIWKRINDDFTQINETENRRYIISASHGIEEFTLDSSDYIDNIINSADGKMYEEKRIMKMTLQVIRQ